jgi:WD40 repeat protein
MATRKSAGIFISYARKDGAELAARLHRGLSQAGFNVWRDTDQIAGGETWTTEIEQALDQSQVVLALLTPASYISEICRAEQLRSLRKGKCVIPILAQPGADIPLHLEAKNYRDLTARPYAPEFQKLLQDIRARKGVKLRPEYRVTYVTAPPLPRNYVDRPGDLASLRNRLVTDGGGPSIALTALEGMGGIGKTVLAQALCQDPVIQQAFPDGVIWTTAGKESTYPLMTRMQEVRRALGDEPADKESELQCINRYRTVIRDKAALVIVDDVWRSEDVEPFRAESLRSRLLFTTRDAGIAAAVGAEEQIADLLTPEQSRDVLAQWSGTKVEDLPLEATELIRECGRLPLALGMIGAMLRGKPRTYWGHVHDLLRKAEPGLFRPIQVSVDALEPRMRERYLALAVLLEDMPAQPAVQRTLWNADEFEALDTAELFVSLSLAQRDGDNGIRLHDLQLDYVRAQYPDRETLGLIHGALRLSSHVLDKDPTQFASQMVGRLLPHGKQLTVQRFTTSLTQAAPRPWLRPLKPKLDPPGAGLLRTLFGHSSFVNGVALSPDGRRAVSASSDKTLKVWDLETGRELHTLPGHSNSVYGVAVSQDGRRAVSASSDKTLKVWDLETRHELYTLAGHFASVYDVAASLDGHRVVSASSDGKLKVWDLETGRELYTLAGHSSADAVAVSPDGRRAVSASGDKTLKVWDLETGRELHTLAGHSNAVLGVALSPDGRRAVSASEDKTLKVWDLETGRELRTLVGHSESVYGVALSPDGRRAVSASEDKTLKVWDLETGRELRTLAGHLNCVHGVAVSADGQRAVSASWDHTLKVWDLAVGGELRTLADHSDSVLRVAVSLDGRRAVSASWDHTLKVWDLESGRELRTLAGHSSSVLGVAVSPDGRRAVSASLDHTLKVWDLETGREQRTFGGHSSSVLGVAVSPDGRHAVSASWDKTLKVWDLETGRELRTLTGHSDSVNGVALSADGRRAVSASWDQTLKVWDLESGRELRTLAGHSESVRGVGMSPDGSRAVSASVDKTLKVWDLGTGGIVATFTCDVGAICCAFAGDHTIIAGDRAGRVHFLSLELPQQG